MLLRNVQELSERDSGRVVEGTNLGEPQVQELASLQAECQELMKELTKMRNDHAICPWRQDEWFLQ